MHTEYEATFENIDKDEMREKFAKAGAKILRPEYLRKRFTFSLPDGCKIPKSWIRVLDNGKKFTLALKIHDGNGMEKQKELEFEIGDFKGAVGFLERIGCRKKSFQESRRELWMLNGVEISIDEWPFLEPFVEIEGNSESEVKAIAEKLGFDWSQAQFCAVGRFYHKKYNLPEGLINHNYPKITFDMENPFLSHSTHD